MARFGRDPGYDLWAVINAKNIERFGRQLREAHGADRLPNRVVGLGWVDAGLPLLRRGLLENPYAASYRN
jgi:hypothetical protein